MRVSEKTSVITAQSIITNVNRSLYVTITNVNRSLYVTIGTSSLLSKSPAADVAPFGSLGKIIVFNTVESIKPME